MSLISAAGQGLSESLKTQQPVSQQANTNLRASQALLSHSMTGRNTAYQINPTSKNNPLDYVEDDDSLARGIQKSLAEQLGKLKDNVNTTYEATGKKVSDSIPTELGFTLPGPSLSPATGIAGRLSKALKEVGRSVTSLSTFKSQGNKLEKATEALVKLAKAIYLKGGSVVNIESPIVAIRARLLHLTSPVVFTEADDIYSSSDTYQIRSNYLLTVLQKFTVITSDAITFATSGAFKVIQSLPTVSITLQAGKDLILTATFDLKLYSKGPVSIGSTSTILIEGSAIDIKAAGIINLGGGTATPITPDTIQAPNPGSLQPLSANKADKLPQALLPSSGYGVNPSTVMPPRVSKTDQPNF